MFSHLCPCTTVWLLSLIGIQTVSKKEANFSHFDSAKISREGGRVKMSTTWKIVGGESKSYSFTFDEPALDMSVK
jgi:hypothetical protein